VLEQTQQDVLNTVQQMINDYDYYTEHCNGTSCNITYIVKEKSNVIVACVGIKKNTIVHLRVKKNVRHKGIGSLLIYMAENIIKARFYLEAFAFVHCNNNIALKVFAKNNYFPINRWNYCYHLKKSLY